jgi:MerR family transcriptional regulator, light-induced transcriptional regulator
MVRASESASELIRFGREACVLDVMNRQRCRWPGLEDSLTPSQVRQMEEDTRFHLDFLSSALWFEERLLLDDYLVWCKVLFANLNLPSEWIEGSLLCIADSLDDLLSEAESAVARAYIEGSLEVFRTASIKSTSFIHPGDPLGDLAQRYLHAALRGERFDAVRIVLDAVEQGTPVRDIYTQVLQPTQREVGRLWQLNELSVAQEHHITSVTEAAMSRLSDKIYTGAKYDRGVVTACPGDEFHDLGIGMITDFFEMDRWRTHYLGANTPNASIVEAVRQTKADVLALSATMSCHVREIAEIIATLRADDTIAQTKVIVGGYPFEVAPDLWEHVGADGSAPDAEAAVRLAAELVAVHS